MKLRLSRFLLSSWLWAIPPTLIISFFIIDFGNKYSISIETKASDQMVQEVYADLNGDGITELIHAKAGPPLNNFSIMDNDGNHYNQWNLPDELTAGISQLYIGNYDQDHFAEIYVFTTQGDSIFINVNEFFERSGLHLDRVFITTVNLVEGHIDSNLKAFGFFDQNNDGKGEFYFRI
ncbi:MAG: hypothetical protein JJE09_09840, partial [Bacteroidia bacterium]|nr:hypothetical protein [Bacteroidia bacterium]